MTDPWEYQDLEHQVDALADAVFEAERREADLLADIDRLQRENAKLRALVKAAER